MASSSKSKAKGPRFYDYLDGLREEFELQSNSTLAKSAGSHRFNTYLDGLKCEFEILTEDIESLRKERDEFEVKVEVQAMELRNVRNDVVCQRCSKGTTNTSQNITVSPLKTLETGLPSSASASPTPVLQKLNPSQTTHSKTTTLPSPLLQASDSTANLASGSERGGSTIPNDEVGKRIELAHALSHKQRIRCVKFSQDGKYLAAGCRDGKSYIYDVQTGTLIHVLRDLLAENDFIVSVCFSRDGKYLATGSNCGIIFVWEINTKYVRNTFKGIGWIGSLEFSPKGRVLISTSNDSIRLWSMRCGATKEFYEVLRPYYTSAVFSPDGAYIAASHTDGVVRVWHVRTCRLIRRVKAQISIADDVRFTPDGMGLVSGGNDRTLKLWDISPWTSAFIRGKSQKSDLDRSVSAHEDQSLPEREYSGHKSAVYCLAISPDGRYVASGSFDRTVRIWDTRSGALQCSLDHNIWVNSVDFSPAGHYLASGEYDGTVRIWRYSHTTPAAFERPPFTTR